MKLTDVHVLRKERPRAGNRKAIEKDEDEEDHKKDNLNAAADENNEGEKEGKEQGVVISKASGAPQVVNLLSNHYVSLQANKGLLGGPKRAEDGKEEEKRKKKINYTVNSLMLNNNELRDLAGLNSTLPYVLPHGDPTKLLWINLSYNYLTKIDAELLNFP